MGGGRKNGKLQKIKFLHNIFFFEADWSEGFEPILGTAILSTNQPVKSFSLKTLIFLFNNNIFVVILVFAW